LSSFKDLTASYQGSEAFYTKHSVDKSDDGVYLCCGLTKDRSHWAFAETIVQVDSAHSARTTASDRLSISAHLLEETLVERLHAQAGQVCTIATNGRNVTVEWLGPVGQRYSQSAVLKYTDQFNATHVLSLLSVRRLSQGDFGRHQCRITVDGEATSRFFDVVRESDGDREEPEIRFLPDEDVFKVEEGYEYPGGFRISCAARGNHKNLRVVLYKNEQVFSESESNEEVTEVIHVLDRAINGSYAGVYVCRAFWSSGAGIRSASRRFEMLVEKRGEKNLLAGSSSVFRCKDSNGSWNRATQVRNSEG